MLHSLPIPKAGFVSGDSAFGHFKGDALARNLLNLSWIRERNIRSKV
jgi:hypothetical protein